jgi:hypothetical protein
MVTTKVSRGGWILMVVVRCLFFPSLSGWMRARVIVHVRGFGWVWVVSMPALLVLAAGVLALVAVSMLGRTVGHPSPRAIHVGEHVEVEWHDRSYPAGR